MRMYAFFNLLTYFAALVQIYPELERSSVMGVTSKKKEKRKPGRMSTIASWFRVKPLT